MSAADGFSRKELWRKWGKDFMVEVSRHEVPVLTEYACLGSEGPHRWCVYAYIYPKHPHFAAFNGTEDMWQDAATSLPFHGGPSLCRKHIDAGGSVTSYQVGADYNHYRDDHYTHYATPEDARDVFDDANALHAQLTAMLEARK